MFCSKLKSLMDYQNEVNSVLFNTKFQKQFFLYLDPESAIHTPI